MIGRCRLYAQNVGTTGALINLLVVGYIVYMQVQLARSGTGGLRIVLFITLPIALFGLLGPRLVLDWLIRHAARVMRTMQVINLVLLGLVGLLIAGVLSPPWWSLPIAIALIFLSIGVNFWVMSDGRIYTRRALRDMHAGGARPE